jgi:hypothetical protein
MALDSAGFWLVMMVSFMPLATLFIAGAYTQLYRKIVSSRGTALFDKQLPLLVRLHGASFRTIRTSLGVFLGCTVFMFVLPALVFWLFSSNDFTEYTRGLPFWVPFWTIAVCVYVGAGAGDSDEGQQG